MLSDCDAPPDAGGRGGQLSGHSFKVMHKKRLGRSSAAEKCREKEEGNCGTLSHEGADASAGGAQIRTSRSLG